MECKYCNKTFKNTKGLGSHVKYCKLNPNRETKVNKHSFIKGNVPWNKGLTKEKDDRVSITEETKLKLSKSHRGLNSEETKSKISNSMKGNRNANHRGDRQTLYNGIRMDSSWEAGVACYFDTNGIKWEYGKLKFTLSDGRVYHPDFEIVVNEEKIIVEVKGYFRKENKLKFGMFLEEYPDLNVELWDKKKLIELDVINTSGYLTGSFSSWSL